LDGVHQNLRSQIVLRYHHDSATRRDVHLETWARREARSMSIFGSSEYPMPKPHITTIQAADGWSSAPLPRYNRTGYSSPRSRAQPEVTGRQGNHLGQDLVGWGLDPVVWYSSADTSPGSTRTMLPGSRQDHLKRRFALPPAIACACSPNSCMPLVGIGGRTGRTWTLGRQLSTPSLQTQHSVSDEPRDDWANAGKVGRAATHTCPTEMSIPREQLQNPGCQEEMKCNTLQIR
jgi:hypothetical protein